MKRVFLVILMTVLMSCVWAESVTKTVVETLVKSTTSWDGSSLPVYNEGTPEITILKITIPPKTKLVLHEHPVINAGVMISGELTVTTEENKVLHLKEGEALVEVVDKWHYGENKGDEPAVIIVFYAGVKDTPITIKEK